MPPYPKLRGGAVISSTIDRYAHVTLSGRNDRKVSIRSLDFNMVSVLDSISDIEYDGKLDFVKAALKLLNRPRIGMDVSISSDASPGSGLGSSSAVVVAILGALKNFYDLPLTSYQIADFAYKIEREELGIKGGMQDQYSAAFGGLNFIEFKTDHVVVNPLRIKSEIMNELSTNLVLCNTGKLRLSSNILSRQIRAYEQNEPRVMKSLEGLRLLATEMKDALLMGNVDRLASLLDDDWHLKKRLDAKVSSPYFEKIYRKAKEAGALGGKILGAGGGGYFLFYCDPLHRPILEKALLKMRCSLERFGFEPSGLQTWRVGDSGVVS